MDTWWYYTELEAATSLRFTDRHTHTAGVAAWPWPRKKAQLSHCPLSAHGQAQGTPPVCGLSLPDPASPKRGLSDTLCA